MSNDHFVLGDYNAICFECGRKRKASQLKKHWKGYRVCPEHWEPRHPQDLVGTPPPTVPPSWTQPVPEPVFVESDIPVFEPFDPTE